MRVLFDNGVVDMREREGDLKRAGSEREGRAGWRRGGGGGGHDFEGLQE